MQWYFDVGIEFVDFFESELSCYNVLCSTQWIQTTNIGLVGTVYNKISKENQNVS